MKAYGKNMKKVLYALLPALWLLTYSQIVGDMQLEMGTEGCFEIGERCFVDWTTCRDNRAFEFAWPAGTAAIPVVGQLIAFGWATALTVAHGEYPRPRLEVSVSDAMISCNQKHGYGFNP